MYVLYVFWLLLTIILCIFFYSFYSGRPALGQYNESKGALVYTTYGALRRMVEQFASGLRQLMSADFHPMVAMCANSRMEWYISDFACILLGLPTVSNEKCYCACETRNVNLGVLINKEELTEIVNGGLSTCMQGGEDCRHPESRLQMVLCCSVLALKCFSFSTIVSMHVATTTPQNIASTVDPYLSGPDGTKPRLDM